jgi:predicted  nucleic acid-binding Zn-ribbon protein
MSDYDRQADDVERELDDMERQSEHLEDEIKQTREDWERKKKESWTPSADNPSEEGQQLPPEADYESKDRGAPEK